MSGNQQHTLLEDEGTGYLASVSDLMSGLIFIFIITLIAYVLTFQTATERRMDEIAKVTAQRDRLQSETARAMEERDRLRLETERTREQHGRLSFVVDDLTNARRLRAEMIQEIARRLDELGVRVEVDTEHGILHLTEQAIQFASGRADLPASEEQKLAVIGGVLRQVLPCYVARPNPPSACDAPHRGKLESVFLEGHTDNMPYYGGRFKDNWDLSAQRAMYTYRTMVLRMEPTLAALTNANGFPVFSVSGYGEGRPRSRHEGPTPDAANRRIDLRFIMTPPSEKLPLVEQLKEARL